MRLKDKVAIITGSGTGIGKASALLFAKEGARVVVNCRTRKNGEATVKQIKDTGGEAIYLQADVSKADQVKHMVKEAVRKYGRLDILFNNAGVRASIGTILDITEEDWNRILAVDLTGAYLCTKYAVPEMKKNNGGSVIMCSSISAHIGQVKQGAYNAAKGGMELLMKCAALDFAPYNIRVNSICPGWVRTEMNREQLKQMEREPRKKFPPGLTYEELLKLHPLGRLGEPEDCAYAALFLASDESSWITGASIMVDGGYTAQ